MENKHYFVLFILSFIISLVLTGYSDCQNKENEDPYYILQSLNFIIVTAHYLIGFLFIYSFSNGTELPPASMPLLLTCVGVGLLLIGAYIQILCWVLSSSSERIFYMVSQFIPWLFTLGVLGEMLFLYSKRPIQPLKLNNLVSGHLYIVFIPLFITISAFINLILCSGPDAVSVTPSPAPATLVTGCKDIKDKTKCNESRSCLPDENDKIKGECDESQKSKCYWVENSPTSSTPNPSLSPADKCIYDHDKCDIIDCNTYQPTNRFVDCCPVFDYEKFMDNVTKNEGGYDSDKKDELEYNLRRASQEEFHRRDEMDDDIYA